MGGILGLGPALRSMPDLLSFGIRLDQIHQSNVARSSLNCIRITPCTSVALI